MIHHTEMVDYLRAGFPVIWLKTDEPERVQREIEPMIKSYDRINFSTHYWDLIQSPDPMEPIKKLIEGDDNSVMFAFNYHWFIGKPQPIQAIKNAFPLWAAAGKCFVIVSHKIEIPAELDKDILVMEMELPGREAIVSTINHIVPEEKFMPTDEDLEKIVRFSKGLTRKELESVFSLSLIRNKKIDTETINAYKAQALSKTGFLRVIPANRNFSDVVGYDAVKNFILDTIEDPTAKGVLFVGPPGCGKTSLAEAIVGETGKFGLIVDMGKLFSKFIGDTDKNVDMVISIITAIGDCFVLIDEFEKQFAGAGGSGDGDHGTSKRALSKWLDFLQNRPEGVYIAGTANSFIGIPPEYLRPGRWDTSPFYIDLPGDETRKTILQFYAKKHKIKAKGVPEMSNFSGAEIEALVNVSRMKKCSLEESKQFIIPIAQTMSQEINALRDWAKVRCVPADKNAEEVVKRRLDIN
ncbi:MAG: AAA family ATPase [Desulfobacteraceae bacterium]|jgi:SpoVK/Ycf46/Vps4 family AAA+-type ATPase